MPDLNRGGVNSEHRERKHGERGRKRGETEEKQRKRRGDRKRQRGHRSPKLKSDLGADALMLPDNGICCIHEFEKMNIHNKIEDDTINRIIIM
ncbi:hypothetical protein YC2023_083538 [Brassica napus]